MASSMNEMGGRILIGTTGDDNDLTKDDYGREDIRKLDIGEEELCRRLGAKSQWI